MTISVAGRQSVTRLKVGLTVASVLLAALLLGSVHLGAIVGFRVASPSLPLWQNPPGDLAQAVLGTEAFLRDRTWHLPLAATDRLLVDGRSLSIVYTDSAPWLSIAVKAIGLDETDINVIGLVLCANFLLQPATFAVLLLAAGVRRAEVLFLGVVLGSLLPAWYWRSGVHVALSSHWIVILALALGIHAVRTRVSTTIVASFCGLGALSIGVHAYLFAMVAAVALSAMTADVARGTRHALPRAILSSVAFLAVSAACGWLLGYRNVGSGGGGFGLYSMNLLSPFVPQISGIRAWATGDAGPIIDATSGQYEGYNYLGAGILLVLGLALVARKMICRLPAVRRSRAAIPIVLALVALTVLALSNRAFVGHAMIFSVKLPGQRFFNELRSSGRLFWPVAYALLASALAVLDKLPRRGLVASALVLAAVLQLGDTSVLRHDLAATYAAAPLSPDPALEPWRSEPLAGHDVRLLPRFLCTLRADEDVVRALSLILVRAGRHVDGAPSARIRPDACADDQFAAVTSNQAPNGRVDVLLGRSLSAATLAIAAETRHCVPIALGSACGSDIIEVLKPVGPAPALAPLYDGEQVDMTSAGDGRRLDGPGWSGPEPFGTWTESKHAIVVLPLAPDWKGGVKVIVDARAFAPPPRSGQAVDVSVNGQAIVHWQVPRGFTQFEAEIPSTLLTDHTVILKLFIPDAISPFNAQRLPDWRTLGITVRSLAVEEVPSS